MNASSPAHATIDPQEARRFGAMAAEWWDPKGSSAMLHRLNPVRLRYIRAAIDRHWSTDAKDFAPLAGRRAIDVGCGAGLLAEPLARLGADVTGVDAAAETIAVARTHAAEQGLTIDYRHGEAADLIGERYDLVACLEVIEHVADPAAFVRALAALLAPGGLMILSTPNRTPLSRLALITVGETLGGIPKGTHDWGRFLTPDELSALVEAAGLCVRDVTGIMLDPTRGFALSGNLAMDYLMTVTGKEGA
ncbi:bifunctional 2-polyprenyl-6-hydroxyphenol methylase/3-demethylubiquinol 3-O-methyltransferase UbiG [Sphingomonas sp. 1P06PA]|uniref:bifunctional 2-polyprenyl-6-hydroxyphenol methylase/3-demethylubiquinol 3-O-methyltransferase UbiG n=1 Tax=Sphingomonas sp. 1P06PA TaxID=554121 RepID=UPI0039A4F37B